MKPYNVKCLFCQKDVYVPKYRIETFKFCSRSCKGLNERQNIKAFCAICGKEFEHISSRCKKAKYCSRLCYHHSQIGKGSKEHSCAHCGIKFMDSPCKNRKYCSKKCTGKGKREEWHPKFTTIRKKMLKENMLEKCEECGYSEVNEILGVHHIDGNRENNCRTNLMVLCPLCHSLKHRKHITH